MSVADEPVGYIERTRDYYRAFLPTFYRGGTRVAPRLIAGAFVRAIV